MLFNDIAQIKEQVEQTSNYPSNIVKFCYMFTWDHHFIAHVVFWAKKNNSEQHGGPATICISFEDSWYNQNITLNNRELRQKTSILEAQKIPGADVLSESLSLGQ